MMGLGSPGVVEPGMAGGRMEWGQGGTGGNFLLHPRLFITWGAPPPPQMTHSGSAPGDPGFGKGIYRYIDALFLRNIIGHRPYMYNCK